MNVSNLKYIKEIARTSSITQAAKELGISQPRLSKTIKELENTLGFAFFERSVKGVVPTAKGLVLLSHVEEILEQLDNITRISRHECGHLSVAIPKNSALTEALAQFIAGIRHKDRICLDVFETNALQIIHDVADKKVNLGVISCQHKYNKNFLDYLAEKKLGLEPLWKFENLLLMSSRNPLAQAKKIRYEDLADFTEIMHGDNVIPYFVEGNPADDKTPVKKIYVYGHEMQFNLLNAMPDAYMWLPSASDKVLKAFDLVLRRCPHLENSYLNLLIFRHEYHFTALDKDFTSVLFKLKDELLNENNITS